MKQQASERIDPRVKHRLVNPWGALVIYGYMLLLVGIQTGLIVGMETLSVSPALQATIMLLYWAMVAFAFVMLTNAQMKRTYDQPLKMLSAAAKKVAEGDLSVYVKPIHTEDKADYMDVMFMDFNKMVSELGSIETLKDDFIANVSHEIKTPLAIIRNYTTMLQNKALGEQERDECLQSLSEATDRLSSLVTNILKLNKLESQQIQTSKEPYDLCAQLADCALSFEPLWEKKGITFDADMEDQATFIGNEDSMCMVWNNLIANAIKFTPEGGHITLTQTSDAERITVTLTDTGCGMDDATMRHIFDKFYQGDTSHSGEGNGLGLALANRIIERADGSISVVSSIGKGSTFTVYLPVKTEDRE